MISFITALVLGQVQIISEPTATPTLAPPHQCLCTVDDGLCSCSPSCDCRPATKVVAASVMKPAALRVGGPGAPITKPPDPDDINTHPGLMAFVERHKTGQARIFTEADIEAQLEAENSVRRVPTNKPFTSNFRSDDPPAAGQIKAASPSGPPRVMPTKAQPPALERIDQAAMTYACVGGVCKWVPAGTVTQQAQPQQRRRLLPWRR